MKIMKQRRNLGRVIETRAIREAIRESDVDGLYYGNFK